MDQFFEKMTSQQDAFDKLGSYIPGFKGYVERQTRRDADKLLRDTVARRFEEHWKRASQLQSDMISSGLISYVDDMEKASIQLRTFIDKITTAPRLCRRVRRDQDQRARAPGDVPVRLRLLRAFGPGRACPG